MNIWIVILLVLMANAFIGWLFESKIKKALLDEGSVLTKVEERLVKHFWFLYLMVIRSYKE